MTSKNHSSATVRCAIYTRKSTEEGLEQNFNSLDAQREAALAYIQSQKHEGWTWTGLLSSASWPTSKQARSIP
jgi:site-specific DNA recombinase